MGTDIDVSQPSLFKQETASDVPEQQGIPASRANTVIAKGYTLWSVWNTEFVLAAKYLPYKAVGKGAYGVVCAARVTQSGEKVAIKKIGKAFEDLTTARRTLREVKLLAHLAHENVITLKDIIKPPARDQFQDVYLVYELMDTDMHQLIRSKHPLNEEYHQYFLYQILRGLKYIHSANVLHRDLKPSNLLLNASCQLKICDFGLARTSLEHDFMTGYVVTRWYRAPELLLPSQHYTAAIDMWSVGCILGELLGRRPVFPGSDYVAQLKLIVGTLGAPSEKDLSFITNSNARSYLRSLRVHEPVDWRARFPQANPLAVDLMARMLTFDPRKRITVTEALSHPWLAQLHNPDLEPSAPAGFQYDDSTLDIETVRHLVLEEVQRYNG